MESNHECGTSLNNRATLVQFKLAELRSDKPFLWDFKLVWHLVQAAGYHLIWQRIIWSNQFLFLIVAGVLRLGSITSPRIVPEGGISQFLLPDYSRSSQTWVYNLTSDCA